MCVCKAVTQLATRLEDMVTHYLQEIVRVQWIKADSGNLLRAILSSLHFGNPSQLIVTVPIVTGVQSLSMDLTY